MQLFHDFCAIYKHYLIQRVHVLQNRFFEADYWSRTL